MIPGPCSRKCVYNTVHWPLGICMRLPCCLLCPACDATPTLAWEAWGRAECRSQALQWKAQAVQGLPCLDQVSWGCACPKQDLAKLRPALIRTLPGRGWHKAALC